MAKLGQIPLIPSIEGTKRFEISGADFLLGDPHEWRAEVDAFIQLLYKISDKTPLDIEAWTSQNIDYNIYLVDVKWSKIV